MEIKGSDQFGAISQIGPGRMESPLLPSVKLLMPVYRQNDAFTQGVKLAKEMPAHLESL
jgi:hypothetical protein